MTTTAVIVATGRQDPREVVADEFAGQALTFLRIVFVPAEPLRGGEILAVAAVGFLVFRIFDIAKRWPIRKLEKLAEGWGVLADALMVALYAGAGLLLCLKVGLLCVLGEGLGSNGASLSIPKAGALGILQGLTEFLPVSSSGHLVLLEADLYRARAMPEKGKPCQQKYYQSSRLDIRHTSYYHRGLRETF